MHLSDQKPVSFKIIASCTLGTFLEFFDYTLYGYFADVIGQLFFPHENPTLQMLATWAIFSVGFLIRPLGAVIFGHMADKKGRNKILPLTILLMAFPTVLIGLLPTYESIGWLAPFFLVLCRLLQGLAISAEYNGSSIYILENDWQRSGLLGALTPFSCGMGMLAASLITYLFIHNTHGELTEWQWRLPFIIAGLVVGIIGWYLRRTLNETDQFIHVQKTNKILKTPLLEVFKKNKLPLLTNIFCSAYMGVASYLLLVYMATYLHQQFHLSLSTALICTIIAAFIEANCTLIFGWLSDFVGRWQVLLLSSFLMVIASILFAIKPDLSTDQLIISLMILVILLGAFDGPLTIYLPELFITNKRYSATAVGYNIGGSVLGGLSPFCISIILQYIHSPRLVLGIYLGSFAILASIMIVYHHLNSEEKNKQTKINEMIEVLD